MDGFFELFPCFPLDLKLWLRGSQSSVEVAAGCFLRRCAAGSAKVEDQKNERQEVSDSVPGNGTS